MLRNARHDIIEYIPTRLFASADLEIGPSGSFDDRV